MRFRKKPVVIEAHNWVANGDAEFAVLRLWISDVSGVNPSPFKFDGERLSIMTLEGEMEVSPGDWIIRGVKGEFYPCKPDIFAATYTDADQLYECTCPMCEHHTTAREMAR